MLIFPFNFQKNQGFELFSCLLVLGLSACGGGGGGSGSGSGSDSSFGSPSNDVGISDDFGATSADNSDDAGDNTGSRSNRNTRSAFAVPSKANVPEIRNVISTAARSQADGHNGSYRIHRDNRPYSTTQSSDPAGDEVHFEWLFTRDRQREPWISFYPRGSVGGLVELRGYSVNDVTAREIRQVNGQTWADLSFYRRYGRQAMWDYIDGRTALGPGEVWVYVQTDADGDGDGVPGELSDYADTDYLAGGVWLYVPETVDPCDGRLFCDTHQAGAFANGNDPFDGQDMDTLAGSATYEGKAVGVYSDSARVAYFEGKARLTAYFGSNTDFGSLQGEIFDITGKGGASFSGTPVVTLERTGLFGNVASFLGDATHNDGSSDYTGEWGGHFYGSNRNDGIPGSAAGTFGVSNGDGSKSYLGAFGTHLSSYDPLNTSPPNLN